jgi:hypothetical protein
MIQNVEKETQRDCPLKPQCWKGWCTGDPACPNSKIPWSPQNTDMRALIQAARFVLAAWDADDDQEKNDLSEQVWDAIADLRNVLRTLPPNGGSGL